jgi:hypothetical protein
VGGTGFTHILFLPITFKQYTALPANQVPAPSAVVCIGCDSHYGPNRRLLETSFPKPYTLYLEYPSGGFPSISIWSKYSFFRPFSYK